MVCWLLQETKVTNVFLWEPKGTPPMPPPPQEIAGPNKALLRETNGNSPLIRPYFLGGGGIGGAPLGSHDSFFCVILLMDEIFTT